MSYPPPRYDGASGEASAWVRHGDEEPALTYPNGVRVHYLATAESTGGLFGLYRWVMGEQAGGPDPHFHRTISESFYVIDGTVSIYDGRQWTRARAGDFLHVPPGGVHAFRNEHGPAEMLLHFAPGAPRESYFEGLARLAAGEKWTEQEFADFMVAHDNLRVEDWPGRV